MISALIPFLSGVGEFLPGSDGISPKNGPKAGTQRKRDNSKRNDPPKHRQDSDLWLYRDRTLGMLRRYLRLSIEVGRLPSLLGREFFRTRVTSYTASTFEDAVIFVHDVEQILNRLEDFDRGLIAKIVFQDYTQQEAAARIGCTARTVGRRFPEVIDRVSDLFLKGGLLEQLEVEP